MSIRSEEQQGLSDESEISHHLSAYQYLDDYRIIVPNGWGIYVASSEGGHQLASSDSESPNILDTAFNEDGLDEFNSTGSDGS